MLMLSSNSTSPRSSRPTMLSSSFSAFSNDMSLMSRCFAAGLAMSLSIMFALEPGRARHVSSAGVHQRLDMHAHRLRQRGEVVAAFEHGYQPAVRMLVCNFGDLGRRPGEIRLDQAQVGQWIVLVGVEPGRDQHDVGPEAAQGRQDARLEGLLEPVAGIAGPQGRIPDVADARLRERAGAGIERHLMRGAEVEVLVAPEDVLRAVAVVHVE